MTTGDPYSQAEVTNSGTEQDAILNFVIPRGACCCCSGSGDANFLSAYSTAPQPGTSGQALVFDRNALSNGSAVTHSNNSADLVIQQAGYYRVNFHGAVAPASNSSFPLPILVHLQQNGTDVVGSSVRHTFQSKSELENYVFDQIIKVDTTPTTLRVLADGGNIIYSDLSITVHRLGDL